MLRTVEAHVLKKMGKTSLVVVFENGAHFLGDVEIGLAFWFLVMTDVIGETIFKLSDSHCFVHRNRRHLLG